MTDQELFLGYIKAYNAKDVSGMLNFFADDCVFENISAGKVTVRAKGKAELEALARKSADAFSSREQRVLTLTGGQGQQFAFWPRSAAVPAASWDGVSPSGPSSADAPSEPAGEDTRATPKCELLGQGGNSR